MTLFVLRYFNESDVSLYFCIFYVVVCLFSIGIFPVNLLLGTGERVSFLFLLKVFL